MWTNSAASGRAHAFHTAAWGLWLLAAMFAALGTRNPYYLLLVAGVSLVVNHEMSRAASGGLVHQGDGAAADRSAPGRAALIRVVVFVSLAVAVLKGLSYHIGATVLFRLPEGWPVVGGPITLEGMASAALDALALLTVLAVFAAFSAGADYYALLRGVPAFMHQVALVTSIAITFVPQTVARFSEIREAQALRGHRVRRVGDVIPLVMPLLAGGMERSMNLAEAMEARGFSRAAAAERRAAPMLVQAGIAGGLGLVLAGAASFAMLPGAAWLAWSMTAAGAGLLALTLWRAGAGVHRTRYRRSMWRTLDTPLALVSGGVLAVLLVFKVLAPSLLSYTPFPRIAWPSFDLMVAVAVLALLAPAAILRFAGSVEEESGAGTSR